MLIDIKVRLEVDLVPSLESEDLSRLIRGQRTTIKRGQLGLERKDHTYSLFRSGCQRAAGGDTDYHIASAVDVGDLPVNLQICGGLAVCFRIPGMNMNRCRPRFTRNKDFPFHSK